MKKRTNGNGMHKPPALRAVTPAEDGPPEQASPIERDMPEALRWKLRYLQDRVETLDAGVRGPIIAAFRLALDKRLTEVLAADTAYQAAAKERDAAVAELQEALGPAPEGAVLSNLDLPRGKAIYAVTK